MGDYGGGAEPGNALEKVQSGPFRPSLSRATEQPDRVNIRKCSCVRARRSAGVFEVGSRKKASVWEEWSSFPSPATWERQTINLWRDMTSLSAVQFARITGVGTNGLGLGLEPLARLCHVTPLRQKG